MMHITDAQAMLARRVIGASVSVAIDGTERQLDLTALATGKGYPMTVKLEAVGGACYVLQGGSAVALATVKDRIQRDAIVEITVESADQAYIAVQRETSLDSGTIVATRVDML